MPPQNSFPNKFCDLCFCKIYKAVVKNPLYSLVHFLLLFHYGFLSHSVLPTNVINFPCKRITTHKKCLSTFDFTEKLVALIYFSKFLFSHFWYSWQHCSHLTQYYLLHEHTSLAWRQQIKKLLLLLFRFWEPPQALP